MKRVAARSGIDVRLAELNSLLPYLEASSPDETIVWSLSDGDDIYSGAAVPEIAKAFGCKYYGNSASAHGIARHKFLTHCLAKEFGERSPRTLLQPPEDGGSWIVKPECLDNNIGIMDDNIGCNSETASRAHEKLAKIYGSPQITQEYISGISVRVNYIDVGIPELMPSIYVVRYVDSCDSWVGGSHFERFMEREAKQIIEECRPLYPSGDNGIVTDSIKRCALKFTSYLKLRDFFSFDFIVRDSNAYFIELNTCPFIRNPALNMAIQSHMGVHTAEAFLISLNRSFQRQEQSHEERHI